MKEYKFPENNQSSVSIFLKGGLGNQIFQYIAGEFVRNEFKCKELKIFNDNDINEQTSLQKLINIPDLRENEYLSRSNKIYRLINKIVKKSNSLSENFQIFFQYKLGYNLSSKRVFIIESPFIKKNLENLNEGIYTCKKIIAKRKYRKINIKIDGFWQDPSPYIDKLDEITVSFKKKIFKINENYLLQEGSYIAIHVRRGDYVSNSQNAREYYSKFSLINYLISSINLLPSEFDDFPLVVVSDDLDWFRKINVSGLSILDRKFILKKGNEIDHWHILNNARVNIISNSTFSYTAALLNNINAKSDLRVIMPFWYNENISTFDKGWQSIKGSIAI